MDKPDQIQQEPNDAISHLLPKCNGLQSKPAGPAISAFLGPH